MDTLGNAKSTSEPDTKGAVVGESPTPSTFCPSCEGMGYYDIGDCEDGVAEVCPECDGKGDLCEEI